MKLVFLLTLSALLSSSALAAHGPNFIVINIDDLGYGDIEPFVWDHHTSRFNTSPFQDNSVAFIRTNSLSLNC